MRFVVLLVALAACDGRGVVGSTCAKTSQCRSGLACLAGQCTLPCLGADCAALRACETESDCLAGESCANKVCVSVCAVNEDCDASRVCQKGLCAPGCRRDDQCAGTQLCLDATCTAKLDAWKPVISFDPPVAVVWAGQASPVVTFTAARGMYDTTDPQVTGTGDANVQVSGNQATLISTNQSGSFTLTVSAQGRAGVSTQAFTFQVNADNIYAYTERASQPDGMTVLKSDGSGIDLLEGDVLDKHNQPSMEYGASYGMVPLAAAGSVHVLTDLDQRRFALHRTGLNKVVLNLGHSNDTMSTETFKRSTCKIGDGRIAPSGAKDAQNCAYVPHSLSASSDGRYVAFHVTKSSVVQVPDADCHDFGCAIGAGIAAAFSAIISQMTTAISPGPVVVVDTSITPTDPLFSTNMGTTPSMQVLGGIAESATATGTIPLPPVKYSSPAISSDGSTLFALRSNVPACPGGGCKEGRECDSLNVCVPKKCKVSADCGGAGVTCDACINSASCSAGTIGPTGSPSECCNAGGGFCTAKVCTSEPDAACASDQHCVADGSSSSSPKHCLAQPVYTMSLMNRATLSEKASRSMGVGQFYSSLELPVLMQPAMVGNDRVAYTNFPDLAALAAVASTGASGPTNFFVTMSAALSAPNLSGPPKVIAPRSTAIAAEGDLTVFVAFNKFSDEFNSVTSCIAATGDLTARQACVTDCRTEISDSLTELHDANHDFSTWCSAQVSSGHQFLRYSFALGVRPSPAGDKVAVVQSGFRYAMANAGECAVTALQTRFCGAAGASVAPTDARGGSYAGLVIYDVATDTSVEALDGASFSAFIARPTQDLSIIAPQFIADGTQVAFFAEGAALAGTGPQAFVVNTDGSNVHKLSQEFSMVRGSNNGGCACGSSGTPWAGLLFACVVLLARRRLLAQLKH